MKNWLLDDMRGIRTDIAAAYLFGSAICSNRKPHDVDLVIISQGTSSEPSWLRVAEYRDSMVERFKDTFQLPLSAMVVTPSEWSEFDGVIVRDRISIF